MSLFTPDNATRIQPLVAAILVFVVGLLLTLGYAINEQQAITEKNITQLQRRAELRAADIEASLKRALYQVESIANFFASSEWVSFSEFAGFVEQIYPEFPQGRRVSILANVTDEQLPPLLQKLRSNETAEFRDFQPFSLQGGQKAPLVETANSSITFIQYTYPAIARDDFVGRQMTENLPLGPSIFRAIRNRHNTVIGFFEPLQAITQSPFFVHISPIMSKQTDHEQQVAGLVTSSQYLNDVFETTEMNIGQTAFRYALADAQGKVYYFPEDSIEQQAAPVLLSSDYYSEFSLQVFDRHWTLYVIPNESPQQQLWQQGIILLTGTCLAILLASIVYLNLTLRVRLEKKVDEKTRDLNDAVETLRKQRQQLHQQNEQLEQAVHDAQEAARAKSSFLANMSHEIRTPLNGVIGLTQLLQNTHLDAQQTGFLSKMESAARHLLIVINDILDYSKISANSIELEQIPFSLMSVHDFLQTNFEQTALDKGIDFCLDIDPDVPLDLIGDLVRLNQVLLNLCSNAIKFTSQGGVRVTVTAQAATNPTLSEAVELQFVVADTGIGMSQETISGLFTEFSQADTSTTRKYGGTGLGLVISQQLCRLMGGDVTVTSQINQGSRFVASVQLLRNNRVVLADERDYSMAEPKTILVVDDNVLALKEVAATLTKGGARVLIAKSGKQGLAHFKKSEIDIVITDWCMPEMDGEGFLKAVLAQGWTPKIIVITAYDVAVVKQKSDGLKISTVLQKPCPASQLFDAITTTSGGDELPAKPVSTELHNLRILVAEDNAINQVVIENMLQNAGAKCQIVSDGVECLETLKRDSEFDLILMDIQMPVLDGVAATQKIRADNNPAIAQLPIIALTANVMKDDVDHYIAHGMNSHVAKPIDANTLYQVIQRTLVTA
ncbi:response regulator [Planctobacterium marinum]|uniref:response regulator n=1 Tax=Planctobacterium marinum TaxID=1631968 RepID=UPI001E51DAB1|nr:response regulator [Planctobacterium marinum]MCC2606854.1 response regulator [Planctobacterium marinum]